MNTYRKITIVLFVVLILGITSGTAVAGAPPPVPTIAPTAAPPSPGGYTPPSYSAPPAFQPYTEDLKSTDGNVIGKLSGIDYSTVRLTASRSATIGDDGISVDLGADMSSKPSDAKLDINIGDEGNVPGGMDNVIVLSMASISAQSKYGWSVKSGTITIKFTIPASRLSESNADTKYYIVRYDGTGYQVIPVNVLTGDSHATIEAKIPDISGTYTLVMSCPPKPAPTSTPSPTPAPAIPCPTPAPEPTGISGWLSSLWISAFGTFAIGEVAGAFILLTLGRFMK